MLRITHIYNYAKTLKEMACYHQDEQSIYSFVDMVNTINKVALDLALSEGGAFKEGSYQYFLYYYASALRKRINYQFSYVAKIPKYLPKRYFKEG
jgi:hypothetical protein